MSRHSSPAAPLDVLPSVDPTAAVWGFHVHQDLTADTAALLPRSLAAQSATCAFLQRHGIVRDVVAAFRPGYGPHRSFAWEIRVESSARAHTLTFYGMALAWHAFNHRNIGSYIHPNMHDESLPGVVQLHDEGVHHANHTVFFGPKRVDLNLDFFFHPPLTSDGTIADTRNPHHIADDEVGRLAAQGMAEIDGTGSANRGVGGRSGDDGSRLGPSSTFTSFIDPFAQNFIHEAVVQIEFGAENRQGASALIRGLLSMLHLRGLFPSSVTHYQAGAAPSAGKSGVAIAFTVAVMDNEPWHDGDSAAAAVVGTDADLSSVVVDVTAAPLAAAHGRLCKRLGTAVAWLFCNRYAMARGLGLSTGAELVDVFGRFVPNSNAPRCSGPPLDLRWYLGGGGVLHPAQFS